ncbi:MAG: hypothetical protein OXR73_33240 [Myxococcales bacterium]|nr:hypothetical protein [Myxococcales bacterium]
MREFLAALPEAVPLRPAETRSLLWLVLSPVAGYPPEKRGEDVETTGSASSWTRPVLNKNGVSLGLGELA